MSSCWRYAGKRARYWLYGRIGLGLGPEEVVVPDADEPEQHRQVRLERRGAEVLVDRVEAGEHLAELLGADGDHQ